MRSNNKSIKQLISATWIYRYIYLFYKAYSGKKNILRKQLCFEQKKDFPSNEFRKKRIFIPLIETSHYQFYQILGLAKALELRGVEIKLLLCNSFLKGCELKSVRSSKTDPCLDCRFNKNHIVPLFNLNTVYISEFISSTERSILKQHACSIADNYPESYIYKGMDIIPVVDDSVIRYYYGATPLSDSKEMKRIRAQHIETILININVAHRVYETWKPDIVMCNMNVYTSWDPYFSILAKYGIRYSVVSMSTFDYNSIVLNRIDIYKNSQRFDKWVAARSVPLLLEEEKEQLYSFLDKRFSGRSQIFIDNEYFDEKSSIKNLLKIDTSKRNIFLFTNIYWDVGLSETGNLYKGVIPWVIDTIEMLKDVEGCQLYIKTHPAEVFDSTPSQKGVIQFIKDRFPVLPSNITVIRPELKIKAYNLFPYIDLGIVFNGTLGLEMLLKGIPVVITGLAPYGYLRSISIPSNITDYKEQLMNSTVNIVPDSNEVELFAYFYFVKALLPWNLTKQVFANEFNGFSFQSLSGLLPGKNKHLDHLCNCIIDEQNNIIENWE
jgi:hypothetical protein